MDPSSILSAVGCSNPLVTYEKGWIEVNELGSPRVSSMTFGNGSSSRSPAPAVKPKRPLSAYNLFFQAERKRVQASLPPNSPKIAFTEMAKIISKKWKLVDQDYKAQLMMQAKIDKSRYETAMKKYREQLAEEVAFLQEQECSQPVFDPEAVTQAEDNFRLGNSLEDAAVVTTRKLHLTPHGSRNPCQEFNRSIDEFVSSPSTRVLAHVSCAKGVPSLNEMERGSTLEMMTRPTNVLRDATIQGLANELDTDMRSSIISLFR